MKKFTVTILFFLVLGTNNTSVFCQENEPVCVHTIRHRNISNLLEYLFKKYGVEMSEQLLLKMKNYEAINDVFVLFSSDYNILMERMNNAIQIANNQEELDRLMERKAKFVKFEDIEMLLN